jgi:ribose/xylose/arabinose/galactoside ABC-type transport system permease subunit
MQATTVLRWVRGHAAANALLLGVIGLLLIFSNLNEDFLTVDNFRNIFIQSSFIMVVAVPTALLLIAGKVDLSVGSILALGAVTTGLLLNDGMPLVPAILIGVLAGTVVGTINGFLVTVLDLSPIIVTLGALTAVRGLAQTLAPNPVFGFPSSFITLGEGEIAGIPYLVLVAVAVLAVGAIVLSKIPVGRHIYAIGVNPEAAYLSGVRVAPVGLLLFIATGAAAGLAGVMLAARLGSAPSAALGIGFELEVLTAVILGGVAFNGGRGTIFGVFLGVIFLGILQNGLTLENVPAATALMVKGGTLVIAAWLDRVTVRSEGLTMVLAGASNRKRAEVDSDVIEEPTKPND